MHISILCTEYVYLKRNKNSVTYTSTNILSIILSTSTKYYRIRVLEVHAKYFDGFFCAYSYRLMRLLHPIRIEPHMLFYIILCRAFKGIQSRSA